MGQANHDMVVENYSLEKINKQRIELIKLLYHG
jgi:hypothetical protein